MSDLVEKVAKVLHEQTEKERAEDFGLHILEPWDSLHESAQKYWHTYARATIAVVLEEAAKAGELAQLPDGFQWGHEAKERFEFGKERAASAIRALATPAVDGEGKTTDETQ